MFTQLETERLKLVWFDQSDIDDYTILLTDATTHPFIVESGPIDPNAVASRIRKNRTATKLGTSLYWTARLKDSREYVGFVALHAIKSQHPVLSYAIIPKWRRQGFASEAIRAVVDFALDNLGKPAVLARTHLDNDASRSLLVSQGFKFVRKINWSNSERLEFLLEPTTDRDITKR